MKANAERKTYAGHGKPAEFLYLGTGKAPIEGNGLLAKVGMGQNGLAIFSVASGTEYGTITGNTKFWAVPAGQDVEVEVDGLQPLVEKLNAKEAELAEARELAEGFAAREAALVAHVKELEDAALFSAPTEPSPSLTEIQGTEIVSVPAEELDGLLEALEAAGKSATVKMEAIRKNRKASYADRLHCKFLEGTAKTAAWVLEEFGKLDEF